MKWSGWRWWRIDVGGLAGCFALTLVLYVCLLHPIHREHQVYAQQQRQLMQNRGEGATLLDACQQLGLQLEQIQTLTGDRPLRLRTVAVINEVLDALAELAQQCHLDIDHTAAPPADTFGALRHVAHHADGTRSHQRLRSIPSSSASRPQLF